MLTSIKKLMTQAAISKFSIGIQNLDGERMSVVLTATLPPLNNAEHIGKDSDDLTQYYALRSALSTPICLSGTEEEIVAGLAQHVQTLAEPMNKGVEALSALAIAAKIDAAKSKSKPKKETKSDKGGAATQKGTAGATAKDTPKAESEAPKAGAQAEQANEAPKPSAPDAFSDFDFIDSI